MPTATRFGPFELDKDCRSLRLEGRDLSLQPQVFDVLAYLIDHRERVVGKDELLDTLWPGVVVTESSLQRAISLARTALAQGGLGEALRNYPRRGYRFHLEPEPVRASDPAGSEAGDLCFAEARWTDAMEHYAQADRASPLDAAALERWGLAAQCNGDLQAAMLPLERAAVAYSSRGEHEPAARVLISLARTHTDATNAAVAQGCLRRARRLLGALPAGVQHGLLEAMSARLCLGMGEREAAIGHATLARDIGRSLQNADVEAMGLMCWGIALQAGGDTVRGLQLQDEAAACVVSGDVSPLLGGLVYCGMISSCCNCGDWHRAEQWNETFTRWCQRGSLETFTGACLIHQAEVLVMSGRLAEAREVMGRADPILRRGAPWALSDAGRLNADLLLAAGDLDAAERGYREAHQRGWDTYPGYARLLQIRGRSDEAIAGLKRAAALTGWQAAERRAGYLAHAAQIAAAIGRVDEATALLAQLDAQPNLWATGALSGQVHCARGELLQTQGRTSEALLQFQQAVEALLRYRAVMDAALARVRLAQCLREAGEHTAAELERAAAQAVFEAAGATGYVNACRALKQQAPARVAS